jgi:dATP pyrophosphohydrolase
MTCGNLKPEKLQISNFLLLNSVRLPIQVQGILFRKISGEIQYLLLKRTLEREGFWQPVTGGLEEGETRVEALERELLEETGIKNLVRIIEDVYYFELPTILHEKEYVYGVEVLPTEEIEIDNREHSEYRWCSLQEALKLLKWKENKEALEKLHEILSN